MAFVHLDAPSLAVGFIVGGAVALAIANSRWATDDRDDLPVLWLVAVGPILAFVLVVVLDLLHVTK